MFPAKKEMSSLPPVGVSAVGAWMGAAAVGCGGACVSSVVGCIGSVVAGCGCGAGISFVLGCVTVSAPGGSVVAAVAGSAIGGAGSFSSIASGFIFVTTQVLRG